MSSHKFQLPNGLQVVLKPLHTAPIVSVWLWYRHGSRDEAPGESGRAHWIEHMQFKGTPRYPSDELNRQIARAGGVWNAFTSLDWTAYFTTVPTEALDLVLDMEADRMVNNPFREADVRAERTVILSEMEGDQNNPYARLSDAVQAAAFQVHPYGHPVIGSREDLLAASRDDLYARYRRYYRPNNAVLSLAGHFSPEAMRDKIAHYFGGLEAAPRPAVSFPAEPPLAAERRVEIFGQDQTPFLQVAYRTPASHHPDTPAIHILGSYLTGPAGAGVFGGSLSNKTSYLYRKLVASGQAVGVHGSAQITIDPFLFTFGLTLPDDGDPHTLLQAFDQALAPVLAHGLTPKDLQRAAKQAQALFAYGIETVTQQASWLGFQEMLPDSSLLADYLAKLQQVTPADVLRAARTWFRPGNRVVGIYLPEKNA